MSSYKKELISGVILVVLVILILNPMDLWMPDMTEKFALIVILATYVLFVGFILKEKPQDEREEAHLLLASRIGYLFGLTSLVGIFLYQSFTDYPDVGIVIAITLMIVGKLLGFAISQKRM